jgi:hypothetical protein
MVKMTKEEWDAARLRLYGLMVRHVGPDKKIGMGELFEQVFLRSWHHRINDTRNLRTLITEMRNEGMPVCSDGRGYWNAASASELSQYFDRNKKRALTILGQISRMKKVSLPEYLGQMQLELEEKNEKTAT